jgi:hypothetical protein
MHIHRRSCAKCYRAAGDCAAFARGVGGHAGGSAREMVASGEPAEIGARPWPTCRQRGSERRFQSCQVTSRNDFEVIPPSGQSDLYTGLALALLGRIEAQGR